MTSERVLALIPAKGKSVRLPRKNVIDFMGKPMLAWTLEAAAETGLFDDIVVSTEDREIAEVSKNYGASVPFVRPNKLAVDPAGVEIVALDALDRLEKLGKHYDTIMILLATSPLREAMDIEKALAQYRKEEAVSLMSVTEFEHSPYAAYKDDETSYLTPIFAEMNRLKSQELPKTYRCNGAIHILNVEFFKKYKSYTCEPLLKYVMPRERSVDIDSINDLEFAEFQFNKNIKSKNG